MNRHQTEQIRRNVQSRDEWDRFASHREKTTRLIRQAASKNPRTLGVLGAGNCNDLDLNRLKEIYSEIHLIDLDGDALAAGVQRQGVGDDANIVTHAGIELSGISDTLARWSPEHPPDDVEFDQCLAHVGSADLVQLPMQFDVVASVCLLTQLFEPVIESLGERHVRCFELIERIRLRHIQLLMELLHSGGTALLVTDFVSSDTYPNLADISDSDLSARLVALISEQNFFTGANPFAIASAFRNEASIASQTSHVATLKPWRWDFGPRVYAVSAIRATKTC